MATPSTDMDHRFRRALAAAVFTGFSGACNGAGSCQVSPSKNRSVQANFEQEPAHRRAR